MGGRRYAAANDPGPSGHLTRWLPWMVGSEADHGEVFNSTRRALTRHLRRRARDDKVLQPLAGLGEVRLQLQGLLVVVIGFLEAAEQLIGDGPVIIADVRKAHAQLDALVDALQRLVIALLLDQHR